MKRRKLFVLEDNSTLSVRRHLPGIDSAEDRASIVVRLSRIRSGDAERLASARYEPRSLPGRGSRCALALRLIDRAKVRSGVIIAGPVYATDPLFLKALSDRGLVIAGEIRPSTIVGPARTAGARRLQPVSARDLLKRAEWRPLSLAPEGIGGALYCGADLGAVTIRGAGPFRLAAFAPEGITDVNGGLLLAITDMRHARLGDLLGAVGWCRWVRTTVRRLSRDRGGRHAHARNGDRSAVPVRRIAVEPRSNIALARRMDERVFASNGVPVSDARRGVLAPDRRLLNVGELFAGAGGMGLGFLMAGTADRGYRIAFSGEVNPVYVDTLNRNHRVFAERFRNDAGLRVPESTQPMDLRLRRSLEAIAELSEGCGGMHMLIGGPPCQGLSNANRNSWRADNPNNQLIDAFLQYVRRLRPPVILLENVQGILWTQRFRGNIKRYVVADHVAHVLGRLGYRIFPKILDAAWYGVPQHRNRFFLVGLHRDLGYAKDSFGEWGPFPHPTHGPGTARSYVTVRDAIGDLPPILNGGGDETLPYEPSEETLAQNPYLHRLRLGADGGIISDHIASRHADYVIARYEGIPPGGNWWNVIDTMTNYADVHRTHSNIYRRLVWDQPSVTIGHYRKSMLVHPEQSRGLSVREAARLQSFPDWYVLSGGLHGGRRGIVHKQQQLANAVCPVVTEAIASYLLRI